MASPEAIAGDSASIVELIRALVRIPTRAGYDSYEPLFAELERWFADHGVRTERLAGEGGATIALACAAGPPRPPRFVLDATVDTAPFGDVGAWSVDPTDAAIRDGWLYGRGSGDCKAGVAVFAHLLASAAGSDDFAVAAVFDADEHTGGFGGIRRYVSEPARRAGIEGVLIGYPGNDEIVVGSRGVLRATVRVAGELAPTGSRRPNPPNAIARAARLVSGLSGRAVDLEHDADFPLGPKVTVTGIRGGEGFSVVPDGCDVDVDIRVTPRFDCGWAAEVLADAAAAVDSDDPAVRPTTVEERVRWPAFRLPDASPLPRALETGALRAFGRRPPRVVVGPSNVGNFLAGIGIEATAGFGVTARNLHGVDEAIDLSTVGPTFEAYRVALEALHHTD